VRKWIVALLFVAVPAAGQLNNIFAAGETLDFDLTWLAITGGAMRMTIGPAPNDPSHFRITSVAKTNPSFAMILKVDDEVMSIVNRSDFSTVRYEKHLVEHNKPKDDVTTINEAAKTATRERPSHTPQVVAVPKPVFDPLSLVYHLRSLPLKPGTVQRFTVYADAKVYTLEANVLRTETIGTDGAGTFQTVVVEPKMLAGSIFKDEGAMTIWFTDDERHIPVRIRSELKVGSITANLRTIHSGAGDPQPVTGR